MTINKKENLYLQTLFANLTIPNWQIDKLANQEEAIKQAAINLTKEEDNNNTDTAIVQSIFNAITLCSNNTNPTYYQPISRLNWEYTEDKYLFPTTDSSTNKETSTQKLIGELENECKKNTPNFTRLYYIFKKHGWCIPCSNQTAPDISLFEQSRLAAAIAVCMYDYKQYTADFEADNTNEKRYLLACADLAGIQSFIYNIGHKNALKALKGRSFYLQQMLVSIANDIIKQLELFEANIIYSSGGKFYLLLPNTPKAKDTIKKLDHHINKQLLERYSGNLALLFDYLELSGEDLGKGKINKKWDELNTNLNKTVKNRKFANLINKSFFTPNIPSGNVELCYNTSVELCTLEDLATSERSSSPTNPHYEEHQVNGKKIYYDPPKKDTKNNDEVEDTADHYICEEQYHAVILGHALRRCDESVKGEVPILDINNISLDELKKGIYSTPSRKLKLNNDEFGNADGWQFYGGNWVINTDDEESTFEYWISNSTNIPYLAVLRMDVDNLGLIFKNGFKNAEGNSLATFSRLVQLSSMLDFFFSGYLNKLRDLHWLANKGVVNEETETRLADFMQIVYSGGDDLFIVGRWDIIPDVALWIHKEFTKFTGNNSSLTLSAGIALFGSKYPLFKVAKLAGEAESSAKKYRNSTKNAISFLGNPVKWSDFEIMSKDLVKQWITDLDTKLMHRSLLRTMQELYQDFAKGKAILDLTDKYIEDNQYKPWRWHAAYKLQRDAQQYSKYRVQIEALKQYLFANTLQTQKEPLLILQTASLWADLLTRKK